MTPNQSLPSELATFLPLIEKYMSLAYQAGLKDEKGKVKKLTKLHITEKIDDGWYLSFGRPEFQGGETIKIDEETAKEIMKIKSETTVPANMRYGNFYLENGVDIR